MSWKGVSKTIHMVIEKNWHWGCVSTKTWGHAGVSACKNNNEKGTRLCFQLSPPSCLETRTLFFCPSSGLKSVVVFLCFFHQTLPRRCPHFAIKSKGNDMQQEQNHMTNCEQKRQNLTRKTKTYTQPETNFNIISISFPRSPFIKSVSPT